MRSVCLLSDYGHSVCTSSFVGNTSLSLPLNVVPLPQEAGFCFSLVIIWSNVPSERLLCVLFGFVSMFTGQGLIMLIGQVIIFDVNPDLFKCFLNVSVSVCSGP